MELKVFVIGERDTVLGFSLIGVDGMATDDADVAVQKLDDLLADPSVGIVLVTSEIANRIMPVIENRKALATLPLILEIPDRLSRPAKAPLRDLVRRALGVSI
ncbi:MAG: V-type ATP synthase subunit F [Chloroflexi bacterium]|nr:V-type ATP synthase subunit F [Chloroflexota bacterium]MDA8189015.1 V-type ATP synthase subunit F [Dehalococcoidales bacterium]